MKNKIDLGKKKHRFETTKFRSVFWCHFPHLKATGGGGHGSEGPPKVADLERDETLSL